MLKKDPSYRRLKVGGYGPTGSASYWQGHDHLFLVMVQGYAERYHRMAFGDIQGIVIRMTGVRGFWTAVLGLLLAGSLVGILSIIGGNGLASANTDALVGFIILSALALIFLAGLIWNWLLGPTCVCHVRTAVQTMQLPHVQRLRRAQRLITELTPLIAAAQAGLVPDTTAPAPAPEPLAEPDSPAPAADTPGAAPSPTAPAAAADTLEAPPPTAP